MPKKQIQKNKASTLKQLFYFCAAIILSYVLMVFLVMPLYTRHWKKNTVPDVAFLSFSAAEKIIRKADLVPVLGESKFDNGAPAGFVIFQNPLANASVKKGRRVYLAISKGKQLMPMPDLVGVNLRDARFVLMQRQLEVGNISYEFDAFFPEGVILEQAIEPDIEVGAGSSLDFSVSLGEEPIDVYIPNLYGLSNDEADLLIKKARLTKGRTSFQAKENATAPKVIFQSLEPGIKAAKGDTINIVFSTMAQGQEGNIPW